jgi:hypothetical protein
MSEQAVSEQELANREHVGPNKTGDNIAAKRVANYVWNGSTWDRMAPTSSGGLLNIAYDSVAYTNTSTTVDTYKYYSGGVSGTLVATLTITYLDSSKTGISTVVRT